MHAFIGYYLTSRDDGGDVHDSEAGFANMKCLANCAEEHTGGCKKIGIVPVLLRRTWRREACSYWCRVLALYLKFY